ncbi:MAG: PLDc N-terminal domain-containing protein [Bacteroidales bacterium]|nr:PLDc N-terminal domain-containing protein [Bacteroidales bacterium]
MTFLFLFGGGLLLTLFVVLFIFLIPLLALISALMNDFPGNEKIIWVLIILFLPFLGSVLYFLIGRNQRMSR